MTTWLLCLSVQVNPDYDSTFEFENDFPALQPDAPDPGERMEGESERDGKSLVLTHLYESLLG